MRIIDLTQVADDAILDTHVLAIDDPSQTLKMTVAQLKEVIKAALNDVFVNVSGDVMTGALSVVNTDMGLILKPEASKEPNYILFADADDRNRFYIGASTPGTDILTISSYVGGCWMEFVESGDIVLSPKAGTTTVNRGRMVVLSNYDSIILKAESAVGTPKLVGTDESGNKKWQIGTNDPATNLIDWYNFVGENGIYLHGTGEIHLSPKPGMDVTTYRRFVPGDYSNFDARYQAVNTGGNGENGWHKDTNTGKITQWGKIAGGGAGVQVTFPIAFPNSANSATVTYHRGGAVDYSPSVPSLLPTGMTIDCDNAAGNLFWMVVGY